MSCSYYMFRSNDYYCCKKQDYINSDIYRRYCRDYAYDECPIYRGEPESSSGCYLTSACIEAQGLPDNCEELTVLRNFRDNWLKKQPGGLAEIAEYYAIAPGIVTKINQQSGAKEIWHELYETLVVPCVRLIQAGKMDEAHRRYQKTAWALESQYGRR